MKSALKPRPRTAGGKKTTAITVTGPLKLHRTWQVQTKEGCVERQLNDAGMRTQLLEVRNILARCRTGVAIEVSAFEVKENTPVKVAIDALEKSGYLPACSCEFGYWAAEYGNDVHDRTVWLSPLLRLTEDKKRAVIVLEKKIVRTLPAPDGFKSGTMIMAVRKEQAAKYRDKDTK